MADRAAEILLVLNVIVGLACAVPLARLIRGVGRLTGRFLPCFAVLVGIYFVEGVAMALGMGIPVFSVGLAFVWGVAFGLWVRRRAAASRALRAALFLSLYTCLPAASFLAVPLMVGLSGWDVLSSQAGAQFGIPTEPPMFWPLDTILGFYAALTAGALVFKTVITTGEVSLLIHLARRSDAP